MALFVLLGALGQTVAVHAHQRQHILADLKESAGVDGAGVVGGHGEDGLVDHAAQDVLGDGDVVHAVHVGHLGEIRRVDADEVKFTAAALDRDVHVLVGAETDDAVGQAAQHLAQEAGAHDDGAALRHVGLHAGVDALAQVVAGHAQAQIGLQQQPLQRGDGALRGGGTGGNRAGLLQQIFLTEKIHLISSVLLKERIEYF